MGAVNVGMSTQFSKNIVSKGNVLHNGIESFRMRTSKKGIRKGRYPVFENQIFLLYIQIHFLGFVMNFTIFHL